MRDESDVVNVQAAVDAGKGLVRADERGGKARRVGWLGEVGWGIVGWILG